MRDQDRAQIPMSPLGYFLIPALGVVSVNAARALF